MTTNQVAESSDPAKLHGPWRDHNLHPTSWIEETGNIATAFAYATLLWPDFVEYRGAVFLARAFDATIADQWFDALSGDIRAVEATMNHVHVMDLFEQEQATDFALATALARYVASMWEAKLRVEFPDQSATAIVELGDGTKLDETGPVVTFHTR